METPKEKIYSDFYKKYYTEEQKTLVNNYINQLTDIEMKAIFIAKEHLKTSFDILKSNGFNKWIKKNENNKP